MSDVYQQARTLGEKLVPEIIAADMDSIPDGSSANEYTKFTIESAEHVLDTYEYGAKPIKDKEMFKAAQQLLGWLQTYQCERLELTDDEGSLLEDFIARLSIAAKGEASRSILEKRSSTTPSLEVIRGMSSAANRLFEFSDAA